MNALQLTDTRSLAKGTLDLIDEMQNILRAQHLKLQELELRIAELTNKPAVQITYNYPNFEHLRIGEITCDYVV